MIRALITLAIILTSLVLPAWAQSSKFITLKDGSQIQGRIVSLADGQYTIENPTLGQIKIDEANIVSITAEKAAPTAAAMPAPAAIAQGDITTQANDLQNKILANPALIQEIQALAEDPAIIELMSDPAFMQAAQTKNYEALQNNPRTQELMKNPKVRSLIEKMGGTLPAN